MGDTQPIGRTVNIAKLSKELGKVNDQIGKLKIALDGLQSQLDVSEEPKRRSEGGGKDKL